MKKLVITYLSILVGLFALLSIIDLNGDYVVEQKLWRIYRNYREVVKDPKAVPEKRFDYIISQYEKLIKKYPDSKRIRGAYLLLGRTHVLKKDFTGARDVFRQVFDRYPDNRNLQAEALAYIGKSYEIEKKWSEASQIYDQIIQQYPATPIGLTTPIYLANYYKSKNDHTKTMNAYDRAIRHYRKLASANSGTDAGFNGLRYLSNCYLDLKRWRDAVDTLGEMLQNYLNSPRVGMLIKTINVVSAYRLNDFDVAMNLYKDFIREHPKHYLNGYLQQNIDAFIALREQGVKIESKK